MRPYTRNLGQQPFATPSKACGSDGAAEVQTEPWASAHGPIWKVSLVSGLRHQAFEFFKPVEDDVDLGLLPLLFFCCLDHQKSLPIG